MYKIPDIIVIASGNKHKIKEIRSILSEFKISVKSSKNFGNIPKIIEDKNTFEGNAFKKAEETMKVINMPVLADDSGLVVDALNGAPGVYSSRYSGGDDNDNIKKLLFELKDIAKENRTARFECVMALILPNHFKIISKGTVEGKIAFNKSGTNGFGYDPVFIPDGYGVTFAQMNEKDKNSISHRKNALIDLKNKLMNNYE